MIDSGLFWLASPMSGPNHRLLKAQYSREFLDSAFNASYHGLVHLIQHERVRIAGSSTRRTGMFGLRGSVAFLICMVLCTDAVGGYDRSSALAPDVSLESVPNRTYISAQAMLEEEVDLISFKFPNEIPYIGGKPARFELSVKAGFSVGIEGAAKLCSGEEGCYTIGGGSFGFQIQEKVEWSIKEGKFTFQSIPVWANASGVLEFPNVVSLDPKITPWQIKGSVEVCIGPPLGDLTNELGDLVSKDSLIQKLSNKVPQRFADFVGDIIEKVFGDQLDTTRIKQDPVIEAPNLFSAKEIPVSIGGKIQTFISNKLQPCINFEVPVKVFDDNNNEKDEDSSQGGDNDKQDGDSKWTFDTEGNADAQQKGENALELRVFKCSTAKATRDLGQQSGQLKLSFDYEVEAEQWMEIPYVRVFQDGGQIYEGGIKKEEYDTVTNSLSKTLQVDGKIKVEFGIEPSKQCDFGDHANTFFRPKNIDISVS